MAKSVRSDAFGKLCSSRSIFQNLLDIRFMQMMSSAQTSELHESQIDIIKNIVAQKIDSEI